ncbi:DUF981 family protein [Kitasatospora brasiliensis]|uniref:DUF981 family protein n=1 Tax=Kitasatospora brasiliensis TaxID=3058040 RepID=UPI002931804F|nr:DUF981 family protein [Kitasatospora sp. K002]
MELAAADAGGLRIDWARMPTYNTVMALCAGAGLLLVVALGRLLLTDRAVVPDAWAMGFGALGVILFATGLHMTLTWPLAGQGFAFDNVVFGEPALGFGVLLLFAAFFLWRRGEVLGAAGGARGRTVAALAAPVSVLVFGLGLACFGIAAAGWRYTLFAAPPEEPISGEFADHPMLEASFISALYVLTGVGAVLFPVVLWRRGGPAAWVAGACWALAGLAFLLFGALNYFTHIGLIVNTL